ncbi:MAG TPA: hypothetical protein VJT67_04825 [Longimicrobiaceae bacterium]|nr:hypothetical protein [Longimicrobiaceae bacterium]
MRRFAAFFCCALMLVCARRAQAQQPAPAPPAAQAAPTRLFLDCSDLYCDLDYYRREIPFVDYVRERQDADVHLLVVLQGTGGGGGGYTLTFLGQRHLAGMADTLRVFTRPGDTEETVRAALSGAMKQGLLRFVRGTPAAERLTVEYHAPAAATAAATPAHDPWDHWSFRVGARGFYNGEKGYRYADTNFSLSASRITEAWKLTLSSSGTYHEDSFEIDSTTTFTNIRRDFSVNLLSVRSVTGHVSVGGRASAVRSTYLNYDLNTRVAPAVEYNVFPYSESSRRQLTFNYSVGLNSFDYRSRTIFDRMHETRADQSLVASLNMRQKWGSLGFSAEGATYLDDLSQNRLVLFSNADVRLVKGLSLNFFVTGSRIRDQLNIQKDEQTPEEILLQQRQRLTGFRYTASVGLSYSFGSIFNNVVNPRFGGSSGGIIFF